MDKQLIEYDFEDALGKDSDTFRAIVSNLKEGIAEAFSSLKHSARLLIVPTNFDGSPQFDYSFKGEKGLQFQIVDIDDLVDELIEQKDYPRNSGCSISVSSSEYHSSLEYLQFELRNHQEDGYVIVIPEERLVDVYSSNASIKNNIDEFKDPAFNARYEMMEKVENLTTITKFSDDPELLSFAVAVQDAIEENGRLIVGETEIIWDDSPENIQDVAEKAVENLLYRTDFSKEKVTEMMQENFPGMDVVDLEKDIFLDPKALKLKELQEAVNSADTMHQIYAAGLLKKIKMLPSVIEQGTPAFITKKFLRDYAREYLEKVYPSFKSVQDYTNAYREISDFASPGFDVYSHNEKNLGMFNSTILIEQTEKKALTLLQATSFSKQEHLSMTYTGIYGDFVSGVLNVDNKKQYMVAIGGVFSGKTGTFPHIQKDQMAFIPIKGMENPLISEVAIYRKAAEKLAAFHLTDAKNYTEKTKVCIEKGIHKAARESRDNETFNQIFASELSKTTMHKKTAKNLINYFSDKELTAKELNGLFKQKAVGR